MYYVHLLQSPNADDVYIGFTSDFRRRVRKHRLEHRDWKLVYYEIDVPEKDARLRERRLKQHRSGKVEREKRSQHSLQPDRQPGAG
jgi:predicted GIY-YIG superfamily endonuclease